MSSISRSLWKTDHRTKEVLEGILAGNVLDQFIEEQPSRHALQMEDTPRIVGLLLKDGIELFERDLSLKKRVQQARHFALRVRSSLIDVFITLNGFRIVCVFSTHISPPDNKMIYPRVHPFPSPLLLAIPAFLNRSQETLSRGVFPPYPGKWRKRLLFPSPIFSKAWSGCCCRQVFSPASFSQIQVSSPRYR